MTLIVLHGVESTGKTTLGRRLAGATGALFLPEFGRTWCEIFGTDCSLDDLTEIADNQQRNIEHALGQRGRVISDTDALMTAAWSRMMLGKVPAGMMQHRKADLYLHCANDTPFVDDGLRVFGDPADRARFDRIAREVLDEAGVAVVEIAGDWEARYDAAISAIERLRSE